jgi:hypothetical protein
MRGIDRLLQQSCYSVVSSSVRDEIANVSANLSSSGGFTLPIASTTRFAQAKYFRRRSILQFFGGSEAISRTFEILSPSLMSFAP